MLLEQTKLGKRYKHIIRYKQIISVLIKHGFHDFVEHSKMHKNLNPKDQQELNKSAGKTVSNVKSHWERIRLVLEELGPTFIKLGQFVSNRPDLIPDALCEELQKLLDHVPPFDNQKALEILEDSLDTKVEDVFDDFEREPFSSASIAQVHRGILKNGQKVAVKIQRPGIKKVITSDLEIMFHIAELLKKHVKGADVIDPVSIVKEFKDGILCEIDFENESRNLEKFKRLFDNNMYIVIPDIYKEYSTEHVMIMEFIDGTNLSDIDPKNPPQDITTELKEKFYYAPSTVAGVDIALHDLVCKILNIPLYKYLGVNPKHIPISSMTVGLDTIPVMIQKLKELEGFPIIKLKAGMEGDLEMIKAIRENTDAKIRIDANTGWEVSQAIDIINEIEKYDIEFIEQPIAKGNFEGLKKVKENVNIPIITDEDSVDSKDIPNLVGCVDGINIKLMKCGGIREAMKMVKAAKTFNMQIMIGMMLESSVGAAAGANVAALTDYADLDANILISNDPFDGMINNYGKITLSDKPGLGLTEKQSLTMITRSTKNPIITVNDVIPSHPEYEVVGAFNPAATFFNGEFILLIRVAEACKQVKGKVRVPIYDFSGNLPEAAVKEFDLSDPDVQLKDTRGIVYKGKDYLSSISHIRLARSKDGENFIVDEKPFIAPSSLEEEYGVEDPRITFIDDLYYINYTIVSQDSWCTALSVTEDFVSYKKLGIIFHPENKDVAIFHEKVNGKYVAMHRPNNSGFGKASIWYAESLDLIHWGKHKCLMRPRNIFYEGGKIGGGCAPIKTEKGWLTIYHAKAADSQYTLFAALLDLNEPWKVLQRTYDPIFKPEAEYERSGFFGNTVFTNGMIEKDGKLYIYYGASDDSCCVAITTVDYILGLF